LGATGEREASPVWAKASAVTVAVTVTVKKTGKEVVKKDGRRPATNLFIGIPR
jgi:hypothetical protein